MLMANKAMAIDGDEFRQLISDKTVELYHTKKDTTVYRYFSADGTLLETSEEKGFRTGSWSIEDDDLCFDLGGQSAKCRPIMEQNGDYGTANKKGTRLRVIYSGFEQGNTLAIPTENSAGNILYQGIISDSHSHVKGGVLPEDIIRLIKANRVNKILLMRRDSYRFDTDDKPLTTNKQLIAWQQHYPQQLILGNGMQIEAWRQQDPALPSRVAQQAASGNFKLIGEIVLHGGQGTGSVSPDSPLFESIIAIAKQQHLPVLFHQFHQNEQDETTLLRLLNHYPQVTFIWAHMCGFATTDKIRQLFKHYPHLHCDLAWLPKKKRMADQDIVDENFHFTAQWKDLLEDYPTRFLIGVDLTTKQDYINKYGKFITRFRIALGGLTKKTATQIATKNFNRLFSE